MKPLPSSQLIKQPLKERQPLTTTSPSLEPYSPTLLPHSSCRYVSHTGTSSWPEVRPLSNQSTHNVFSLYSSSANGFIYAVNRYCRVCNKLQQICRTMPDHVVLLSELNETVFVSALIVGLSAALNSSVSAVKLQVDGYKGKAGKKERQIEKGRKK